MRSGQDRKAEEPTESQSNDAASVPEVEAGASNAAEAIIEATTPDSPVGDPDLEAEHAAEIGRAHV